MAVGKDKLSIPSVANLVSRDFDAFRTSTFTPACTTVAQPQCSGESGETATSTLALALTATGVCN